jgi:hypothetical protein
VTDSTGLVPVLSKRTKSGRWVRIRWHLLADGGQHTLCGKYRAPRLFERMPDPSTPISEPLRLCITCKTVSARKVSS